MSLYKKTIVWSFIYLIYFLFAILTFYHSRYGLTPDGVSYIRLAQLWYEGDWSHAVSGYWAPLISWLTVAMMPFFSSPLDAAHAAMILGGFVMFSGIVRLLSSFLKSGLSYWFVVFVAGIVAVYTSTMNIRCDTLFAGLVAWGCSYLLSDQWVKKWSVQILAGFFLALSYYAKSPAIPTFMTLVFLTLWYEYLGQRQPFRLVLCASCMTTIVFLIVITPWIATLSYKYERFCFSTSGGINLTIMRPNNNADHPHFVQFLPPQSGHSTYWEAPNEKYYPEYSPYSKENRIHSICLQGKNVGTILLSSLWFVPCWPLAIIIGYAMAFRKKYQWVSDVNQKLSAETETSLMTQLHRLFIGIVATSACYALPLLIEFRYLYVIWPFLIVLTAVVMNEIIKPRCYFLNGITWLFLALPCVFSPFIFMTPDYHLNHTPFRVLGLTNEQLPDWVTFKNRLVQLKTENQLPLNPETIITSPVRDVLFLAPFIDMQYYGHYEKATLDETLATDFDICVVKRNSSLDRELSQLQGYASLDPVMFPDAKNMTGLKALVKSKPQQ